MLHNMLVLGFLHKLNPLQFIALALVTLRQEYKHTERKSNWDVLIG